MGGIIPTWPYVIAQFPGPWLFIFAFLLIRYYLLVLVWGFVNALHAACPVPGPEQASIALPPLTHTPSGITWLLIAGAAHYLGCVSQLAKGTTDCPNSLFYAPGFGILCATTTWPVALVPVHKLPVVLAYVDADLCVVLDCVAVRDAGIRVTEEARVQQQVARCWSSYDNLLQVVLRMEIVADCSSDVQLAVYVLFVVAIQVECYAVLRPQG